ncbi:MAG: HD domain-containing protein [Planctomycetota bacterium]
MSDDASMAASESMQGVPIVSLREGMQLPFDIFESNGLLLLKRGSVITPRFVANLQDRGHTQAFIKNQDLKKLIPQARASSVGARVNMETDQTRELDGIEFEDSIPDGKALIENFKPRPCAPYDTEMLNQLMSERDKDVRDLSSQLTELVEGSNEMPGRSIEKMTTTYIWHLCQDLDATLSVSQVPRKDDYLANHSLQMSVMGMALAAQLGMPEEEVRVTGIAGLLHDIGMSKVPKSILEATGSLDLNARLEIMRHPIHTLNLTEKVLGVPSRCRLIVYQVHERNNGRGYPRQRTGNKTYVAAKVLGIVDAYLAMINDRPYRNALLPYHAMEQILREAKEGLWDAKIVRAFVSLVGLFPIGSFVMLSDESLAKVIRSGGQEFGKPQVTITHNPYGVRQETNQVIDLAKEPPTGLKVLKAIPPLFDFDSE